MAYGNNVFVAVGWNGAVLTSTNGVHWTSQKSGTSDDFASVVYGTNLFVAVGYAGDVHTSPDGVMWTSQTSGVSASLTGVA